MEIVIRMKVGQHPELQEELLVTGNRPIVEDADEFMPEHPSEAEVAAIREWAIYKGEGKNAIGEILMRIRSELQSSG